VEGLSGGGGDELRCGLGAREWSACAMEAFVLWWSKEDFFRLLCYRLNPRSRGRRIRLG